jgi:D-amino-acid dehydrogenase
MAVIGAGIVGVTTAFELSADGHAVTVFERRGRWPRKPASPMPACWRRATSRPGRPRACREGAVSPAQPPRGRAPRPGRWRRWPAALAVALVARLPRPRRSPPTGRHVPAWRSTAGSACRCCPSPATQTSNRPGLPGAVAHRRRSLAGARQPEAAAELGVDHELVDAERCRAGGARAEPQTAPLPAPSTCRRTGSATAGSSRRLRRPRPSAWARVFRFEHDVLAITRARRPGRMAPAAPARRRATSSTPWSCAPASRPTPCCVALGLSLPLAGGARLFDHGTAAALRRGPQVGPRSALMDETYKVACRRLGQRVRVAGSAELGGSLDGDEPAAIPRCTGCWTTGSRAAAQLREVQVWKGAARCCPTARRCWGPAVRQASG